MPINACGVTAFAPFEPEPNDLPAAPPIESAPFLLLDHAATRDPDGQLEAHAALLRGHDPPIGLDLEVLSFAAEAGPRGVRASAIAERVGLSTADGAQQIHADLLSAGIELSTRSADASEGLAVSASAAALDVEATLPLGHANGLTLGASLGVGFHLSAGLRDIDHNGKPELCVRATEIVTVGACIELPF
jgi:hypothetical protein